MKGTQEDFIGFMIPLI